MLVLVLFPAVPQSRNSANKQNRATADGGGTRPAAPLGNSPWHGRGGRGRAAGGGRGGGAVPGSAAAQAFGAVFVSCCRCGDTQNGPVVALRAMKS